MSAVAIDDLLSKEAIDSVRKPLASASLLPPMVYSDERIFEAEKKKIFAREWLPMCHISQLPEPGSYVSRYLFGEPILALRDRAGEVQVFSNVCRHRNMTLTTGSGKCAGNRIMCPYHGWTYGLDGRLLAAPYMDQTGGFDKKDISLPKVRFEIWQGFVFVNFSKEAASLIDNIKGVDQYTKPYKYEDVVAFEFMRVPVNWNWKVSLENFSEAYHQPWVHPETAEQGFPASNVRYYENQAEAWSTFFIAEKNDQVMETLTPPIPNMPPMFYTGAMGLNVYPYFHMLSDPGLQLWLDMDIYSAQSHDLHWHVMIPKDVVEAHNIDEMLEKIHAFFDPVVAEDIAICKGVKQGTTASLAAGGRLSYMEKAVHQFHNWWLDKMSA